VATGIIVTLEFVNWYEALTEAEQEGIRPIVAMLEAVGAMLGYPQSSAVKGSRYPGMRELRIQHAGRPYRILYAFDPIRQAVLLMGGDKTGDGRWYEKAIRVADKLFTEYLHDLERGKKDR
jgi:hypothetical protein